jgi:hypothetical protein
VAVWPSSNEKPRATGPCIFATTSTSLNRPGNLKVIFLEPRPHLGSVELATVSFGSVSGTLPEAQVPTRIRAATGSASREGEPRVDDDETT